MDSYLQSHSYPQPSFAVDAPTQLLPLDANNPDIEEARIAAIEASIELQQLLQGPKSLLSPTVRQAVVCHFLPREIILDPTNPRMRIDKIPR